MYNTVENRNDLCLQVLSVFVMFIFSVMEILLDLEVFSIEFTYTHTLSDALPVGFGYTVIAPPCG